MPIHTRPFEKAGVIDIGLGYVNGNGNGNAVVRCEHPGKQKDTLE
jgi:hypothetical protein